MIIHIIVYWALCIFLTLYTLKKVISSRNSSYLYILLIELVSIIIQIVLLCLGKELDAFMQVYVLLFNFILPSFVFGTDFSGNDFDEQLAIKAGDRAAKKGNYLDAIAKYKIALTKNQSNSETYAKLGKMFKLNGDRRTAFDRFAKAIELNKDDYQSYFEIGSIFNEIGKFQDAQIVLDNSLRIKPDYTPSSILLASILIEQEKYDEAINVYKNAVRYDQENYEMYYNMGLAYAKVNNFDDADTCYRKALEINPTMYEAYFSLGQLGLIGNDLDKAERMFKKSLLGTGEMAKSYFQLAKLSMLKGNIDEAKGYLGSCIDVDFSYKDKALNEPIFDAIKEDIADNNLVSHIEEQHDSFELSEEKIKKFTKKAQDVDKEEYKDNNNPFIDEIPLDIDEPPEEASEVVDKLNEESLKIAHEEEEKDLELEESDNYIEPKDSKPKKERKFLGFLKNVFGIDEEVDNDFEKNEDEDVSKVRLVEDEEDYGYKIQDDFVEEEKEYRDIEDTYKTPAMDFDENIYEKFKKLKEVEDQKAEKFKQEEKARKQNDYKNRFSIDDEIVAQNRSNKVRYIDEKDNFNIEEEPIVRTIGRVTDEEAKKRFEELNKKRSFDFDKGGYIENKESSIVGETEYNFDDSSSYDLPKFSKKEQTMEEYKKDKLENKKDRTKSQIKDKQEERKETHKEQSKNNKTITSENLDYSYNAKDEDSLDDGSTGFDFLDKYKGD